MEFDNDPVEFDRSVEEVRTVIDHAKLCESDLLPISQVISFAPQLAGENVRLVEVSKELADRLQQGEVLTLRGEDEDGVVLCTSTHTYDVKEAETSNSLLLLPHLSFPQDIKQEETGRTLVWKTVEGLFYKYMELQEVRPRLQKLQELLHSSPLSQEALRDGVKGPTTSDLLNIIQASSGELVEGLRNLEAVEVDGGWHILIPEFRMKVLTYILRFFEENSWPLDCVHKKETLQTLSDLVNTQILSQVFDQYCSPMAGGGEDEYSLENDKVCRFYGDFLLAAGSNFDLPEFLATWQKSVPEGLVTDVQQLSGLALVDIASTPQTIRRFTESDLPPNIHDRLTYLFHVRPRWTLEDVTPYILPLTTPQLNVNALLTKYARPVNSASGKYFCSKHGR